MSLLVALAWSTFTVLCVVVLSTDPSIPHNVTAVRICKGHTFPLIHITQCVRGTALLQLLHAGLPPFIDEAHKKNMMRNNLLRLVTVFVVIIFVWTSQSRITRYRWLLFRYLHIYTHIYISTQIYLQYLSTGSDTTSLTSSPTDRTSPPLTRPSTTPTSRYPNIEIYLWILSTIPASSASATS